MTAINFQLQTGYITPKTGRDIEGDQTFGSPVLVKCKFVDKAFIEKSGEVEEVMYDAKAYVSLSRSDAVVENKFTFDGVDYEIKDVVKNTGTVTSLKHKVLKLSRLLS